MDIPYMTYKIDTSDKYYIDRNDFNDEKEYITEKMCQKSKHKILEKVDKNITEKFPKKSESYVENCGYFGIYTKEELERIRSRVLSSMIIGISF
jgi:hypothetical protein